MLPPLQLSFYLPVYLSVCLSAYLSISLSVWVCVCLPVCPSACLSVCLSVRQSVCLSAGLFVCLSVRLTIYLSNYLYPSLSLISPALLQKNNPRWQTFSKGYDNDCGAISLSAYIIYEYLELKTPPRFCPFRKLTFVHAYNNYSTLMLARELYPSRVYTVEKSAAI
jgi:hypothetical protein